MRKENFCTTIIFRKTKLLINCVICQNLIKNRSLFLLVLVLFFGSTSVFAQNKSIAARVDSVMKLMTLEEKIGQLNQYSGREATGPVTKRQTYMLNDIKAGRVGSMLNVHGVKDTREIQAAALQSRLKIPLLFAMDVIHGYRTVFPIPLAEAASWDLDAIQQASHIAATEASAAGLHWTFAPMVDISRDPRWGRIMEGAGEDVYHQRLGLVVHAGAGLDSLGHHELPGEKGPDGDGEGAGLPAGQQRRQQAGGKHEGIGRDAGRELVGNQAQRRRGADAEQGDASNHQPGRHDAGQPFRQVKVFKSLHHRPG